MFPWNNNNNNNNGDRNGQTDLLMPSSASGNNSSSYYFLLGSGENNNESSVNNASVRDADGGEVIETVPDGASNEDFASRPVGQRVSRMIVEVKKKNRQNVNGWILIPRRCWLLLVSSSVASLQLHPQLDAVARLVL